MGIKVRVASICAQGEASGRGLSPPASVFAMPCRATPGQAPPSHAPPRHALGNQLRSIAAICLRIRRLRWAGDLLVNHAVVSWSDQPSM